MATKCDSSRDVISELPADVKERFWRGYPLETLQELLYSRLGGGMFGWGTGGLWLIWTCFSVSKDAKVIKV